MNKKKLKTISIISASLALAVAAIPVVNLISNANKDTTATVAAPESTQVISKELKAVKQGPDVFYNILPTIKSADYSYEQVKDKTVVLAYSSNNAKDGFNKMDMNVVEYEADGVTPKKVNFTSQVATVQNAHIPYTIYALDKEFVDNLGNIKVTDPNYKKQFLDRGVYDAAYLDTEEANPKEDCVTLESEAIPFNEKRAKVIYTEVTYSINGEEEKTVYAWAKPNMKPDTAIIASYTFEVEVYANVGDKIEYKVKVPAVDGDYYQTISSTVVE